MKRLILRAIGGVALLLLLIYAADYLSVRLRIPGNREPFGSVEVQNEMAVRQKDNKLEYYFEQPQTETCVNALFPHFGYRACWWVRRHAADVKRM